MAETRADVVVALGTRPEVIKLSGIISALDGSARVLHTGQHFDESMWGNILSEFPHVHIHHHLQVGGRSRGEQIGMATDQLTRYLVENPARAMVVQGDTNSTLAGALAANSVGIPVVHVEAGLRSQDRSMPEEINRILVDALSDLCCAPLEINAKTLAGEGIGSERIIVTGNTLADAMQVLQTSPDQRRRILERFGLLGQFVLATIHRASNVGNEATLRSLLTGLSAIALDVPVVLPLHPHTAKMVDRYHLRPLLKDLVVVEPVNPREFMALEAEAALLVSDSGGVQEEACLLRRPLLVLRDSTERPELLDGWCRLLGNEDPTPAVVRAWRDAQDWAAELRRRPLPYSAASASQTIVDEINARWPQQ